MTNRICNQCSRPAQVRGMCHAHYMAWYRSPEGRATPKKMGRPTEEPKQCIAVGCDRGATARGLCLMHYKRQRNTGRLDQPSAEERFFERVTESPDGCWPWGGYINGKGYGQFADLTDHPVEAHRWAYLFFIGHVPDGLQLDHLCRNRPCCNPWHLEPVPLRVNVLRGEGPAARNARKTHCIRNHPFDAANTYVTPGGRRQCRACGRIRSAKRGD